MTKEDYRKLKILVTGPYEENYNRTRILLDGLKARGHDVREHPIKDDGELLYKLSQDVDFVFVPCFMHKYVPFINKNVNCPVVFDPLISKWITNVLDYKKVSRFSLRALKDRYRDHQAMKHSDLVIIDTHERKKMFEEMFDLPDSDIKVVYVGSNTKDFKPLERQTNSNFEVGFVGGFIPLQGVKKIVKTARIMKTERVRFTLIGTGHEYEEVKNLVKKENNIILKGWIPYKDLNTEINRFDLCLGIFGDSIKASSVIPNKIFHYASSGRPILTMDSEAIKELFTNRKDIFLCKNNPQDMAAEIRRIKNSPEELDFVSKEGHKLVDEQFNEICIAKQFEEAVKGILQPSEE